MRFSEKWLRDWVDPPVTTDTLVEQLTTAGLEVDTVESVAGELRGVVVGEVLSVKPHPDADRLRVCEVATGGEAPVTVVCGAPNVTAGMRAPAAVVGGRLPDGTPITRAEIRGQESAGMLCSERELGLSENAEGLMELPSDAPVGVDLVEYLDLDDVAIDIDLTPNRGDCLSLRGIAREVGVINRCEVATAAPAPVASAIPDEFPVFLDAPGDCPRYVGRVIRDVNPRAATPVWMQERLRRSGLRSISPVVDVTNYVMLELGQPMHAFDLAKLVGQIRVRRAEEGESLVLLDGAEVALDSEALVIADAGNPVALAGVMGGLDSSVTESTRDLFLESAFFSPRTLSGTARRYGLQTDSSHRFERGVDSELQRSAAERATALLLDIVGGEAGPIIEQVIPEDLPRPMPICVRAERIRRLLGVDVTPRTVADVLRRLGMDVREGTAEWEVTPPSYRFDIALEADLIEEVARIVGYDNIPSRRPRFALEVISRPEAVVPLARMRDVLIRRGYHEAITYSFVDSRLQALLDPNASPVSLTNPIASDMDVMRTNLWPGLVQAMLHNTKRQQSRVRLFESGLTFRRGSGGLAQARFIAGVATGPAYPEQWGLATRDTDFFDVKADVEGILRLSGPDDAFRFVPEAHPALHPGRAAAVERGGRRLGFVGALHPKISRELKLGAPVYVFELTMARIEGGKLPGFRALSKFPAVRRDIAVLVDESISAQSVRDCVGQVGIDVLENLELFDVYRGEGIDSGKKSVALSLTFQSPSRTLNDEEVETLVARAVDSLRNELGAVLRG